MEAETTAQSRGSDLGVALVEGEAGAGDVLRGEEAGGVDQRLALEGPLVLQRAELLVVHMRQYKMYAV